MRVALREVLDEAGVVGVAEPSAGREWATQGPRAPPEARPPQESQPQTLEGPTSSGDWRGRGRGRGRDRSLGAGGPRLGAVPAWLEKERRPALACEIGPCGRRRPLKAGLATPAPGRYRAFFHAGAD